MSLVLPGLPRTLGLGSALIGPQTQEPGIAEIARPAFDARLPDRLAREAVVSKQTDLRAAGLMVAPSQRQLGHLRRWNGYRSSEKRGGRCGRGAARNAVGDFIAVVGQHADATFDDIVGRV